VAEMKNPTIENIVLSVVWSIDDHLLLIFKNDRWMLPGGHIEPSEQSQDSIIREIAEETKMKGIKDYKFFAHYEDPSPDRHRIYFIYESSLRFDPARKLPFKKNEGIEKMEWFKPCELPDNISPIAKQAIGDLISQKEEFILRTTQRLKEIRFDTEKTLDASTTKLVVAKLMEIADLFKKTIDNPT